jgi:phosphatidate cytidylyltransferase
MLRTRLVVGVTLAALVGGILIVDQVLFPWYPVLLAGIVALTIFGCRELLDLLPSESRPSLWLCTTGALLVTMANWPAFIIHHHELHPWFFVLGAFVVVVMATFVFEMVRFREPGHAVTRMALLVWAVAYLSLLPSFLVQICWPPVAWDAEQTDFFRNHFLGTLGLTITVFVPKVGDVGAYLVGRFLGRHRMTPLLSPKKTWEGFAGGLVFSALTAVLINRGFWVPGLGPLLRGDGFWTDVAAVGFGLTVGLVSVLGDLAESLIKRDGQRKDASKSIPGFGGVLDLVDSVIFAAPVAYCWLRFWSVTPPVSP